MTLHYKASAIAKAEDVYGKKLFEVLSLMGSSAPGVSDLLFLFAAGGGTEDEFDELFEKGIDEVMLVVMKGITDAGFLGNIELDLDDLREKMAAAKKKAEASLPTGKPTKS